LLGCAAIGCFSLIFCLRVDNPFPAISLSSCLRAAGISSGAPCSPGSFSNGKTEQMLT
jgi:hypothetical protein